MNLIIGKEWKVDFKPRTEASPLFCSTHTHSAFDSGGSQMLRYSNEHWKFPCQTLMLFTGWLHSSRSHFWQQHSPYIIQTETIHHGSELPEHQRNYISELSVLYVFKSWIRTTGAKLDRYQVVLLFRHWLVSKCFLPFTAVVFLWFDGLIIKVTLYRHYFFQCDRQHKEEKEMTLHITCFSFFISIFQAQNNRDLK